MADKRDKATNQIKEYAEHNPVSIFCPKLCIHMKQLAARY